jgi:hypothetical protein
MLICGSFLSPSGLVFALVEETSELQIWPKNKEALTEKGKP